jgi:serine/threonine protein kinase
VSPQTLDRDVALKILPESLAVDPDRLMRFTREAKTLATLTHGPSSGAPPGARPRQRAAPPDVRASA